jgi:hypothetical protein
MILMDSEASLKIIIPCDTGNVQIELGKKNLGVPTGGYCRITSLDVSRMGFGDKSVPNI